MAARGFPNFKDESYEKFFLSQLENPVDLIDKMPFPMQWELTKCISNGVNQNFKAIKDI